jgi:hypothetical protein
MSFRLTPPTITLTEAQVVKQCIDYLKARNYWCRKNHVGRFKTMAGGWIIEGPVGIPDYIAAHELYPAFFIEFKRKGKLLRPTQQTEFEVIQFGFRLAAVMVDSLEELMTWLDGYEARVRARK